MPWYFDVCGQGVSTILSESGRRIWLDGKPWLMQVKRGLGHVVAKPLRASFCYWIALQQRCIGSGEAPTSDVTKERAAVRAMRCNYESSGFAGQMRPALGQPLQFGRGHDEHLMNASSHE